MIYISCFLMQAYNGHDEALGVLVNYVDNVDVLDDKGKILFPSVHERKVSAFCDTFRA